MRFNKGDLVTIKYHHPHRSVVSHAMYQQPVGIIVEVQNRSDQNPLWDRFWVLMNGTMEVFPHRTLAIFGNIKCKSV